MCEKLLTVPCEAAVAESAGVEAQPDAARDHDGQVPGDGGRNPGRALCRNVVRLGPAPDMSIPEQHDRAGPSVHQATDEAHAWLQEVSNGILHVDRNRDDAYAPEIAGRIHDPETGGGFHPSVYGRRVVFYYQRTSPADLDS